MVHRHQLEVCPVCGRHVRSMVAVTHYRGHVRRKELLGGCLQGDRHTRFRLLDSDEWFEYGEVVVEGEQ